MPYSSIEELPTQVRGALLPERQHKWLEVFNHALEQYSDERTAFRVAWNAVKRDPDCRSYAGWASVEVIDRQGDVVDAVELDAEVEKFIWKYGGQQQDIHTNRPVGCWFDHEVAIHPDTGLKGVRVYGAIYQGERVYDTVWDEIRTGKKKGLSIGIDILNGPVICDEEKCWKYIKKMHLMEISPVDRPACPPALIDEVNMTAKSDPFSEGCPLYQAVHPVLASVLPDYTAQVLAKAVAKAIVEGDKMEEAKTKTEEPTPTPPQPVYITKEDFGALVETLQKMLVLCESIHKAVSAPKVEGTEPASPPEAPRENGPEPPPPEQPPQEKEEPPQEGPPQKPEEKPQEEEEEKPEEKKKADPEMPAADLKTKMVEGETVADRAEAEKALRAKAEKENEKVEGRPAGVAEEPAAVPPGVDPKAATMQALLADKKRLANLSAKEIEAMFPRE